MEVDKPPPNYETRSGAERRARRLDDYWHARGHMTVQHWAEPQSGKNIPKLVGRRLWVVRSNLVNGMPPGEAV
jgi:hypothetical protein